MMTINFDTITNNYEVIYVIKTVMKYHLKKIDASFHQPLPNMCTCVTSFHISFKITTTAGAASYLDLRLEIDSGEGKTICE
jgi:hypothetical protein